MKKAIPIIHIIHLLLAPLCLNAAAPTTISTQPSYEEAFDQLAYNWTRTFAEVIQLAKKKHYKVADLEQSMIKAIDAFLTNLDPHSSFLDPKTYKSMLESTSGQFFGIGIVIDNTRKQKDKYLTIVDTIPDGPSDKAGIKPLDKIIEIDGTSLEGMSTEEATTKIKGPKNTTVHIKVLRENHPDLISFDIERDVIKEQNSMSFLIKDYNIYYISLNMFTENAVQQIENFLKKSNERPYKGLILDLRNNSGGLLHSAIDIAGLFLEKGSLVVVTKDKTGKVTEQYATRRDPIANAKMPLFILTNNYTASAAEILASCLKSHAQEHAQKQGHNQKSLVFLVGTPSFGKGSVQEVIPVGNNCAAKITTTLYFPNNRNIQGEGITPDFLVERCLPPTEQMQWFTKHYGRESALNNSIKTGTQTEEKPAEPAAKKGPTRWTERAKEMLKTDNQLRETISLINLLQTFLTLCPEKVCDCTKAVEQLRNAHIGNNSLEIEEIKL
ncbi:MAG: hypothetical protein ACD_64C00160G0001 [uncultured bacterium]|nr:MAG: hypothetical protein ACD_64C00160G0001 [uncultured bacterium]HLE76398.1 S41 family peptidase [Candidatus Babeliales bacterium]